ncbi:MULTISPECIES: hypothetical protein [Psychrobacter]|jgi:hypothetical protein|uniref:Pentapeptide MXKDX repeat protein n=1 Tax=Psychrobacter glaciei TaxID=619771 RepID=A0ABQ3GVD3_9GAMM|nr:MULTISPECIES: hypothetical protein [Psychrobacter]MBA6245537.1 hypothetical protein [Psychrobacter sp. Urea-trap-18]MBA6284704.1 hypothetical protein [Psychrobacter sp. Urea-trap-16]MBA6318677.1 hypothetical protein [Psychrobacter sp. Urea-trap-20]MBA6333009.1 hypothetical protein [Psychrobacter sp. Urea-trap-19]PKG59850.1 hypothetical protein CXF63_10245 [Psychrobacter sp. Choline-3u-12]|tara:strand:- start:848 stop:1120 length:273 start_codon:yes stop_codon:yes gene_type:complete
MSQFKLLSKSIAMTVIALVVSTSAMAHDPKLHAKKDQMNCEKMQKNMQMMQKMDHSKMDMKDPAMKAMMANMGKMKQMYQKNCVTNDSKS